MKKLLLLVVVFISFKLSAQNDLQKDNITVKTSLKLGAINKVTGVSNDDDTTLQRSDKLITESAAERRMKKHNQKRLPTYLIEPLEPVNDSTIGFNFNKAIDSLISKGFSSGPSGADTLKKDKSDSVLLSGYTTLYSRNKLKDSLQTNIDSKIAAAGTASQYVKGNGTLGNYPDTISGTSFLTRYIANGIYYVNGSNETGTGLFVKQNSPILSTPNIGAAIATSLSFSNFVINQSANDQLINVTRNVTTGTGAAHTITDNTHFNRIGQAMSSFDANLSIDSAGTYDHLAPHQSRGTIAVGANLNLLYEGLVSLGYVINGRVGQRYGVYIRGCTGSGSLDTNYALRIGAQNMGTLNYLLLADNRMEFKNSGSMRLNAYGVGTFATGTSGLSRLLWVDSSGNFVERTLSQTLGQGLRTTSNSNGLCIVAENDDLTGIMGPTISMNNTWNMAFGTNLRVNSTTGVINTAAHTTVSGSGLVIRGAGSRVGDLSFYASTGTVTKGATITSERMTINSAGAIGIGTVTPNTSAIFDVTSTTKGVLFPRMTTVQKNAISSPAESLIVYDLTLHKLCIYTGSVWETITSL